jgi:hypothetical protein
MASLGFAWFRQAPQRAAAPAAPAASHAEANSFIIEFGYSAAASAAGQRLAASAVEAPQALGSRGE